MYQGEAEARRKTNADTEYYTCDDCDEGKDERGDQGNDG